MTDKFNRQIKLQEKISFKFALFEAFVRFLNRFKQILIMKRFFGVVFICFFAFSGKAQEFRGEEGVYIGTREVNASLSFLAPEVPSQGLTLMEVNFNKISKPEVNLVAVMERERYERESAYIELESPMPALGKTEKSIIQVTNDFRIHDRSSNYDIYTGKKKIPAYKEMRAGLFHGVYSPYSGRGHSPYSFSPLR